MKTFPQKEKKKKHGLGMRLHHRALALVLLGSILNIKKRKEESLLVKTP